MVRAAAGCWPRSRRRTPGQILSGSSFPALLAGHKHGSHRVLVLVTSRMDDDLVRGLTMVHRQGVAVSVVHVARDQPNASGATAGGLSKADWTTALAAAGIRYVQVTPSGDLRPALSGRPGARAPAGRRPRHASQPPGAWVGLP